MFETQALEIIRPNSSYTAVTHGDGTFELIWQDAESERPTDDEIAAAVIEYQAQQAATKYQRDRKPEYPSMADLADALYWNSTGDSTKLDEYYAACAAVKAKYPKPEAD